ncbi:BA14K family protein [Bartonella rochalimae]|uniref:BA14K family protein n=1 Tax=Bartonella rochalimae TaxID=395923 RepID=UPI003F6843FC
MTKLAKLLMLSAISTVVISAPLETVLAAKTIRKETISTQKVSTSGPFQYYDRITTSTERVEHTQHHHNFYEHHVSRGSSSSSSSNNVGGVVAAGLLALTAGIIIKNALKEPEQPQVVYQTPPQNQANYQVISTVTHQPSQQLNTTSWYQYCKKTYRSFNPKTGTFRGHDGLDHVCYAPVQ